MRRRGSASIAANPVLIGAATMLVVLVAVFLAYNANNGLPFVPTLRRSRPRSPTRRTSSSATRSASAARASASSTTIEPRSDAGGRVSRVLTLKLETTIKPLPDDSTVARPARAPRSA